MPSGPTPLGLNEDEGHAIAADSYIRLDMDGGDIRTATTPRPAPSFLLPHPEILKEPHGPLSHY